MTMRIILSTGPVPRGPDDIVIDHRDVTITRGSVREYFYRGIQWRMVVGLLVRAPYLISIDELIDFTWGDDPEGGPENATTTFSRNITHARHRCAALGCIIVNEHGRGYRIEERQRVEAAA